VRTKLLGGTLAAAGLSLAVYFGAGSAIETVSAQDVVYFRIGAGTPDSAYYGMAGQIASIVSNPQGSRDCDANQACGVEGLLGLAQTSSNPVEGLESLNNRSLEATLVSADIADAAMHGTGPFKESGAIKDLRAIANLGTVMLQIIVPAESKVMQVKDLSGKKIAIGLEDSDSAVTARFLLKIAGLNERKAKLVTGELGSMAEDLADGRLDAMAVVEPMPNDDIATLMASGHYRLLQAEIIAKDVPGYVFADWVPAGKYAGVDSIRAIGVPTVLVARADLPGSIAGGLLRSLWFATAPGGEPRSGALVPTMSRASVPWHPSAAEAFRELSKTEPAELPPAPTTN
jgi:TRAP transporter TAXI family solute receptor